MLIPESLPGQTVLQRTLSLQELLDLLTFGQISLLCVRLPGSAPNVQAISRPTPDPAASDRQDGMSGNWLAWQTWQIRPDATTHDAAQAAFDDPHGIVLLTTVDAMRNAIFIPADTRLSLQLRLAATAALPTVARPANASQTLWLMANGDTPRNDPTQPPTAPDVLRLPVDIGRLIQGIQVAPDASDRTLALITRIVQQCAWAPVERAASMAPADPLPAIAAPQGRRHSARGRYASAETQRSISSP